MMIIRYKKNFETVTMGLLSFMLEGKEVEKQKETIKKDDKNADCHLYLWKEEDTRGDLGIKLEDNINVVIQHISVTPSHRNMGIGKKMVNEVKNMYKDKYAVCPDERTLAFYNKCDEE